ERPDDTQTIIDTADLLQELGRDAEATSMLTDAWQAKPRDTDLLFRLSVGAFEGDDLTGARKWADRLIEADSQHLEGWNLRSQIRFKLGDFEGALADHAMIAELSKTMKPDQSFRASCFESMGR